MPFLLSSAFNPFDFLVVVFLGFATGAAAAAAAAAATARWFAKKLFRAS